VPRARVRHIAAHSGIAEIDRAGGHPGAQGRKDEQA